MQSLWDQRLFVSPSGEVFLGAMETVYMPLKDAPQAPEDEKDISADDLPTDVPLVGVGVLAQRREKKKDEDEEAAIVVAVTTEDEYDEVNVNIVRPCCVAVLLVVYGIAAVMAGYYWREHQSVSDKTLYSQVEDALLDHPMATFIAPLLAPTADTCADGLLVGGPTPSIASTVLFLALLLWSFMGVALFADTFMVAIEYITSQEVSHKVTLPSGKRKTVTTLTWNPTVANLTLMALGSSAPEILLSVIEITSSGFYAGELGPSTIVGSAAFNMLIISAVCVIAIPEGDDGRYIKERPVFYITATFSILAYVWVLIILSW